jgi:UDP-N-acetylmuramoyl-tripeptide--D-alanyl-D-alanine ligase
VGRRRRRQRAVMSRRRSASGWLAEAWTTLVFRRPAIGSMLAWPIAYPAAWAWRRLVLRRTRVVAVTGSLGKTSTAAATAAAAGAPFDPNAANYGSFLAAAVLRCRPRRRWLVVEVAVSRPGQMRAYARLLRPDVVILTGIGGEHLSVFGSLDALAREKAILPMAVRRRGLVVVNADDERCLAIAGRAAARVVRVGFAAGSDWRIEQASLDWPHGTSLRLAGPAGCRLALTTRWIGRDLARCAAFAAAASLETGGDPAAVAMRLAALSPTPWRLEPMPLPGGAWLLCDAWKGSWRSTQSALGVLQGIASWRRVAVLGAVEEPEGGEAAAYRRYGRLAAAAAQRILFVGSSAEYRRFRAGAREAGPAAPALEHCADAAAAAAALRDELRGGTVILVKGRQRQKLGRVAMLLRGEAVDCRLRLCPARGLRCELCPRLRAAPASVERAARAAPGRATTAAAQRSAPGGERMAR